MSSLESGSNWKIRLRLTSGLLMVKNGFSVVAPTRMTTPSSTPGRSTSCWALLKRWISSMNSSVFCPPAESRSWASARISRSSFTPLATALSCWKWLRLSWASSRARVVLPRARRAVEDHRAQAVGRQQPAQQLALAEEMLLADELVQRGRPHPRRQRLGAAAVAFLRWHRTATCVSLPPAGRPRGSNSRKRAAAHFGRVLRQ